MTATLIDACKAGNVTQVRNLLTGPFDRDMQDADGLTPLHWAASLGYTEIARLLVNAGADINDMRGDRTPTPLHLAIQNNHTSTAEYLIGAGARVDLDAPDGTTTLHAAVIRNNVPMIVRLLSASRNRIDVNERELEQGISPLHVAAAQGNLDAAQVLLENDADVNALSISGITPLHLAASRGDAAMVERLLKHGANLRQKDNTLKTPADLARDAGHTDLANTMEAHGEKLDIWLYTLCTSRNPDLEEVEKLLLIGANPHITDDGEGRNLLYIAAENQDNELAELLLEFGAHPFKKASPRRRGDDNSAYAISAEDSAVRQHGNTQIAAVIRACRGSNQPEDIAALASIATIGGNHTDEAGNSLLHIAVTSRRADIAGLLITVGGAEVDQRDPTGKTPLHIAVANRRDDIAGLLLVNGANANSRSQGYTPLHLAAITGNMDMANLLLRRGANAETKDSNGKLPKDHAYKHSVEFGDLLHTAAEKQKSVREQAKEERILAERFAQINDWEAAPPAKRAKTQDTGVEAPSSSSSFVTRLNLAPVTNQSFASHAAASKAGASASYGKS